MQPIATLKNLSLSVPHKKLFEQVNFTLNKGDKIGLLGLNGHGKSSLFKVLAEKVTPDTTTPPFEYDKSQEFSLFYVPQELEGDLEMQVSDYFYEFYPKMKSLKNELNTITHKLENNQGDMNSLIERQSEIFDSLEELGESFIHSKYLSYLNTFGIKDTQTKLKDLSGGEQRKVGLALGLSCPHEIVLWDEPTNHLDLDAIKDFEDELVQCNKTFLIISHDRTLLGQVCKRIMHIQNGKLNSFQGGYAAYLDYLREKSLADEKELEKLSNKHRRELAWMRQGVKARRTRSKKRVENYQNLAKDIEQKKQLRRKSVSLNLQHSGRKTKLLVKAKNLGLEYSGVSIFSEVNFSISKGDKIALMGKNGAGKSSLLHIITQDIQPSIGEIKHGHELKIGYFSQKRESLDENLTPWEWIGQGQDYVYLANGVKKHLASYLESFLFQKEEIRRPISTFSGGEKNRLQLAKFMSSPCDLWIFDEPTNDLDLETIGVLEEELRAYEGALIIVSHDRSFLNNVTDKCWLLHQGHFDLFEAGFEQAEYYLEDLKLLEAEKKKIEQKQRSENQEKVSTKETQKTSQNGQARVQELEKMILEKEEQIEQLQKELAEVDYQNLSGKDKFELEKRQKQIARCEKELADYWSELE